MPVKTLVKAKKVKDISRYVGDFAVVELKKPLKVRNLNEKVGFLLVGTAKMVSGEDRVMAWPCDEEGRVLATTTVHDAAGGSIKDALAKIGYALQ